MNLGDNRKEKDSENSSGDMTWLEVKRKKDSRLYENIYSLSVYIIFFLLGLSLYAAALQKTSDTLHSHVFRNERTNIVAFRRFHQ